MSVFGDYARFYDLLYRDKDYEGEAGYVDSLLRRYAPGAGVLLELGCGTGIHAALLTKRGYRVHGIDVSGEMLDAAERRRALLPENEASNLSFSESDIRCYRAEKSFDAVVSLFHVVSYQTSDDDLEGVFDTVSGNLDAGGIFVFDCWYGPAVLTGKPEVRIKRAEDERISVTRIAEPVIRPEKNVVDVNYHVFVRDKKSGVVEELRETHSMRYLFHPEVERLLSGAGMALIHSEEWMTGVSPSLDTWSVCFVGRK